MCAVAALQALVALLTSKGSLRRCSQQERI